MSKSKSQRVGGAAFHEVRRVTEQRCPSQLDRVMRWEWTLRAAFQAASARDWSRVVTLPEGAVNTETGENTDKAARVLRAFDALLGAGVTGSALSAGRATVAKGGGR